MTLEDDLFATLQQLARERGASFKDVLNTAVRAGLSPGHAPSTAYVTPSRPLGLRPGIDLDKALQLAGELEDAEIIRKLELRK